MKNHFMIFQNLIKVNKRKVFEDYHPIRNRCTYFQGGNRETDVQNRLVDTVGEAEGGAN